MASIGLTGKVVTPAVASIGQAQATSAAVPAPRLNAPQAPSDASRLQFPDLAQTSRTFERMNGRQQNVVMVDPQAQAHVVTENYIEFPQKRMVAINQHGGNIGCGLWWHSQSATFLRAVDCKPAREGDLAGTRVAIAVDKPGDVTFETPVLDSVRALRDRAALSTDNRVALRERAVAAGFELPETSRVARLIESQNRLVYERTSVAQRADGSPLHTHRAMIEAGPDTTLTAHAGGFTAHATGAPKLTITYLNDIPQLTPYAPLDLVKKDVRDRITNDIVRAQAGLLSKTEVAELQKVTQALEDLSSLITKEKALAGGWRFLTYFGRDPLQTAHIMRSMLAPQVVENLLQAALERLSGVGEIIPTPEGTRVSTGGELAHEESIADQAAHERIEKALEHGHVLHAADMVGIERPIYDYKMIDGSMMFVSLLADHVLDPAIPEADKQSFLARVNSTGETNRAQVEKVLAFMRKQAQPYADSVAAGKADATKLIRLYPNETVGDWRDSTPGLAGGVYPASVNATLTPATLAKAVKLSHALGEPSDDLAQCADAWKDAYQHFDVRFTQDAMRDRLRWFMTQGCAVDNRPYFGNVAIEPGVTVDDFVHGKELTGDYANGLDFLAVSLDAHGKPIPVMSSDAVMGLIGAESQPAIVDRVCNALRAPYPLGLATEAGLLITNAAFCKDAALYDAMGPGRYHGEVVWPWLEALAIAGLDSQADTLEGPIAQKARATANFAEARAKAGGSFQTAELYAVAIKNGKAIAAPIVGASDESFDSWPGNNPQLWGAALPMVVWGRNDRTGAVA